MQCPLAMSFSARAESMHAVAINELTLCLRVDMQATADTIAARRRGGKIVALECLHGGRHGERLVHEIVSADKRLVSIGHGNAPFKVSRKMLACMQAQIRMSVCGDLEQLLEDIDSERHTGALEQLLKEKTNELADMQRELQNYHQATN